MTNDQLDLATDLLNEFGYDLISVRTANAMAKARLIKRWQDAITLPVKAWEGVKGIGRQGLAAIQASLDWHAKQGNVALIPDPPTEPSPAVTGEYTDDSQPVNLGGERLTPAAPKFVPGDVVCSRLELLGIGQIGTAFHTPMGVVLASSWAGHTWEYLIRRGWATERAYYQEGELEFWQPSETSDE